MRRVSVLQKNSFGTAGQPVGHVRQAVQARVNQFCVVILPAVYFGVGINHGQDDFFADRPPKPQAPGGATQLFGQPPHNLQVRLYFLHGAHAVALALIRRTKLTAVPGAVSGHPQQKGSVPALTGRANRSHFIPPPADIRRIHFVKTGSPLVHYPHPGNRISSSIP